jgi:hypothetical protein
MEKMSDAERLKEIDNKLTLLIYRHYKAGEKYLKEALNASQETMRYILVNDARRSFSEAVSIDYDTNTTVNSLIWVGMCYDLLKETELAKSNYGLALEKMHGYCDEIRHTISKESGKRAKGSLGGAGLGLLLGGPIGAVIGLKAGQGTSRLYEWVNYLKEVNEQCEKYRLVCKDMNVNSSYVNKSFK